MKLDFLKEKYQKVLKPTLVVFLLVFTAIWIFSKVVPFGLNWNITPSIPKGLYFSIKYKGQALEKGDFVCFLYKSPSWAENRKYLNENFQLCKKIEGVAGDTLIYSKEKKEIAINDSKTYLQDKDTRGRPLPLDTFPEGAMVIDPGMFFLKGVDDPRSLDSRYLGLINQREIVKIIVPLIVSP